MPLGQPRSEETKRKISEGNKGKKRSLETRRKISEASKGRIITLETRKKLSEKLKGRHFSLEHRRKIGKAHKGKFVSLETRKKLSEVNKGKKNPWYGKHLSAEHKRKISEAQKGKKGYWYGKTFPLEARRKLSEANKGEKNYFFGKHFSGEKHPLWQGGKSFEPYGLAFNKKLKEYIRARDGYRCQECFKHQSELFTKQGKPKKLSIHHIDYNKQNNQSDNLISLCPKCHTKTNFKRKDWTKHFQKKQKEGI